MTQALVRISRPQRSGKTANTEIRVMQILFVVPSAGTRARRTSGLLRKSLPSAEVFENFLLLRRHVKLMRLRERESISSVCGKTLDTGRRL